MTTDHEEPCGPSHRSFCLNGGLCYVIPTIPSPFCRCIENYTGARCEEIFLPSSSIQTKSDLFTAFVALTVLLGTLILGALYFLCRKGHLQRASSVQYDINLVETSSTSVHHGTTMATCQALPIHTPQAEYRSEKPGEATAEKSDNC
ncbi:PREDICTED: pro-neuregulin-4, membrane-bound isoform [Capra hircus]|uniref:pro-neuregulin-4, membrane-bound isoform n=1 Tax=Capra hircus TaxID=9925 RepID=UPI0003AF8C71|nr:PREDICTED: pro-neuregulin-4, membrane-bound isoform [Capra hircus]